VVVASLQWRELAGGGYALLLVIPLRLFHTRRSSRIGLHGCAARRQSVQPLALLPALTMALKSLTATAYPPILHRMGKNDVVVFMSSFHLKLASMYSEPDRHAFGVLLDRCLQATSHDEVLIFFDESAQRFFQALTDAITKRKLRATFVFVPKSYQLFLMARKEPGDDSNVPLPRLLKSPVGDATVIMTLLDGDLATSSVRGAILNVRRPNGCRVAHVPGLTRSILEVLSDSPIDEIVSLSELLAWALGEAEEGELITYGQGGEKYSLTLQLDGWRCEPLMSPGIIFPNSWGNIPPGETFCCPDSYSSVCGTVCLNGSVPGAVLGPGKEALLYFEGGKLTDWDADSAVGVFLGTEQRRAAGRGDEHWNTFAELGIGLNPVIERLTGNSLFDEKAAKTIHIAIGDNSIFSGPVTSETHADLVIREPTLILNGHTAIRYGEIDLEALRTWRSTVEPSPLMIGERERVLIDSAKLEIQNGVLRRRLMRQDRLGYVDVADEGTSRRLAELVQHFPDGDPLSAAAFQDIVESVGEPDCERLLGLLHRYDILKVLA
jgi:hypothetical protein